MSNSKKIKRFVFIFFCMHAIALAGLMLVGTIILTTVGWDSMGGHGVEVFYLIFFVLSYFPARKIKYIGKQ